MWLPLMCLILESSQSSNVNQVSDNLPCLYVMVFDVRSSIMINEMQMCSYIKNMS